MTTKLAALAFVLVAVLSSLTASQAADQFSSPIAAQQQGISAYKGGYYDLAIPPLEYAASKGMFLAQFYLGQLYADNTGAHTDHPKAFLLFQTIANNHADADPADRTKAPYVAHALTALARYVARGIPEIAVPSDAPRAVEYLHHAATFFNDEDAQFELAKLNLSGDSASSEVNCGVGGEGLPSEIALGRHWLSKLARKGHAGAQAFMADLYSRGLHRGNCLVIGKDPVQALALISIAVKNTPPKYRVWIEDVYQAIYCGASKGVREQVNGGMVAQWDKRYGRKPSLETVRGLEPLNLKARRVCKDGKTPPLLKQRANPSNRQGHLLSADARSPVATDHPNGEPAGSRGTFSPHRPAMGLMHGNAFGGGGGGGTLRNVDETGLGPPR